MSLPNGFFPSGFPTKTLFAPLLPHKCYIPRPSNFPRFEQHRSLNNSLCSFLHSPVTSSLLFTNTPQQPFLTHPQPTFLPQWERPSFKPIQNNRQNYSSVCLNVYIFVPPTSRFEAHGGAVGWGTTLQAGRSRVRFPMLSLDFFIDTILLAALWSWGWLSF